MKNITKLFLITLILSTIFATSAYTQGTAVPNTTKQIAQQATYQNVNSLDVVASPSRYLNKTITIKGKFDKFSTLGLDYAPAMRSSEQYITFLIQRDDVSDHDIPLSEMKIFMKRSEAEKYIDLNVGDEIEFNGTIFSTALGDVWMDATHFTVLNKKEVKK